MQLHEVTKDLEVLHSNKMLSCQVLTMKKPYCIVEILTSFYFVLRYLTNQDVVTLQHQISGQYCNALAKI